MPPIITPEMIYAILAFIAVGVISFFVVKWFKKRAERKRAGQLSETAVSPDYQPPAASGVKGKRSVESGKTLAEWAYEIKNAIHIFKEDDVYAILSVFKRIKTKFDLGVLNSMLRNLGINVIPIFAKGLSTEENDKFVKWQKALPDYYKP